MARAPLTEAAPAGDFQFRHLADNAPVMIWVSGVDKRTTWVNQQWLRFTGRTLEEELGVGWARTVHPDDLERCADIYTRAFDARQPFAMDYRVHLRDGTYRWILDQGTPAHDAAGVFTGYMGSCIDITERKNAEMKLAEVHKLETRFSRFMEHLPGEAWIKDADGRYVHVNDATLHATGLRREEIIGHTDHEIFPSELADRFVKGDREMLASGHGLELTDSMEQADGLHHSLVVKFPMPGPDGASPYIGGIAIDITARKRAEDARRDSDARFTRFMHHLPGLAWIKDVEGRYVFINDAAERAFGHARTQMIGHTDHEIFPAATAQQFVENDQRVLHTGLGVETVETLEQADGVHHSLVAKFPIPGPDGAIALLGGIAIDITARMKAEEALQDADRRKDEFLATLAHELRNPLAPLRNGLELIDGSTTAQGEVLTMMDRQLSHLVRLVDDLMDVSRITRGKIHLQQDPVDLRQVLDQAVETVQAELERRGHQFVVEFPAVKLYVQGDAMRLIQVVSNLLHNAVKYTPPPGHIRLSLSAMDGQALVSVKDDGSGIPPEMRANVFDLFAQVDRTLQRAHGGLGIGLNIVKRLMELHDGTVECHSDGPGKGSEFILRMPLMQHVPDAPRPEVVEERAAPALRVLVVDDNQDIAHSLVLVLQKLGCEARATYNAEEALREGPAFTPHLVLMDIGMPEVDGYELCGLVRARSWGADAFIVAVTGWGQEEDKTRAQAAGFDRHMVKPIDRSTLLHLMKAAAEHARIS